MIKYQLRCASGHEFEAWFQSGSAFDKLSSRRQLSCATCGSIRVEKAVMAPRLARSFSSAPPARKAAQPAVDGDDGSSGDTGRQAQLRDLLRRLRAEITSKADYVGSRFAEEARRIYDDEVPARGIYGEASREEAMALIEEGISILPLPVLPEDHH